MNRNKDKTRGGKACGGKACGGKARGEDRAAEVLAVAERYRDRVADFLRQLIAIPSPSCEEGRVVERIRDEMVETGFDEAAIDGIGNVIGRLGDGKVCLLFDSHVDTVGVGDPQAWPHDPFRGKFERGIIYGRGAADNKAATAVQVYAGRIIKELGLAGGATVLVSGTVQEEDCDGLGLRYLIESLSRGEGAEHSPRRPDYVVLGECTNLDVYRGHRGRMEISVTVRGRSCHASAPERGENAIYHMTPIIQGIERLNDRLADDPFLGRGTVAVTGIEVEAGSINTVPDRCTIYLDRRLTAGETADSALAEIRALEGAAGAEVEMLRYNRPSHAGLVQEVEKYYPTWILEEDHLLVSAGRDTAERVLARPPRVDKWVFSTNGVASQGQLGIPTIGFGPGEERHAHSVEDQVPVEHLVKAMAFYALFPDLLVEYLSGEVKQ